MTQTITMSTLYEKLSQIGFSPSYIRSSALPSWWDDELNDKPTAVLEGAGHIAKRLHLDLSSLLTADQTVQFKPIPQPKFSHQTPQINPLGISPQLASRVTELVAYGVQAPFSPIPEDVHQIRADILQRSATVTLESLLTYCWQHAIAVVYFQDYPPNTRKITGMIQWQYDRPVIVLSSAKTHPDWLAFHLAHELGHLVLGHIKEGILIDDEIDQNSNDLEEMAANQFAVKLLGNGFDNCFNGQDVTSPTHLKNQTKKCLKSEPIVDSCVLALNYSWHTQNDGYANKAIPSLCPDEDGRKIINQFLENHLDWENLSDDNADHLDHILGD